MPSDPAHSLPALARAIRRARAARGLSAQALADALGVRRQAVHQWENGQTEPQEHNLAALKQLLGDDFTAELPVVGEIERAVLRGRTLQIARQVEMTLAQLREMAADLDVPAPLEVGPTGAPSLPHAATGPRPYAEDEGPEVDLVRRQRPGRPGQRSSAG